MPIIEANNLSFSYDNNLVLDHVSFGVDKGDYLGIIGPNGGGKTTLLKILVGLIQPQSGEVKINPSAPGSPAEKSALGYVPQRIAQDNVSFPATVYEIVESGRTPKTKIFGRLQETDKTAIDKALDIAGIAGLKNRLMSSLSGGQRQRVYVARALAQEPEILLLDEPFVGIDIAAQKDFYAFLKKLNQAHGLTILFVSHDIDVITDEVKSVLCLNRGLFCVGSPEILHQPNMIENLYGKKITHIHHDHSQTT